MPSAADEDVEPAAPAAPAAPVEPAAPAAPAAPASFPSIYNRPASLMPVPSQPRKFYYGVPTGGLYLVNNVANRPIYYY